ncbi:MAG: hypothetical protein KGJ55_12170 [Gammaproteobacteria bacterium]|nr:hypothetical protein [Gammaproteobacteria bacterium]
MHQHLTGPFWGIAAIVLIAGAITVACFAAMVWMLVRPGERRRDHPKYLVIDEER